MSQFVGRKEELKILSDAWRKKQSDFIPVYGRRRVGKSELILHLLKEKKGVYYCGKKAQAKMQIREFLQESAILLQEPLLAGYDAHDWKSALLAVTDRCPSSQKIILALDEFQWIAETSPEIPSVLQEIWDRKWKKQENILLILCGSYVGFMERDILGKKSPLFGRRTAQILLKPFGYREAIEFHPSYSLEDRARTYFICGGVPLYLKYFLSSRSVELNIIDNFLNQYAPLYQEPEFLLREELREVENYYAALLAIASGVSSHTAIAQKAGLENRALHYYLKQLVELGYLSRRHPLAEKNISQRKVRYVLDDPLLRFWFRFIYPNTSFILQFGGARAFKERIKPGLDSYFGYCFERLCREALARLYQREGVNAGFQIGEYWDKNVQIDVVGLREDNWTDLGECKWSENISLTDIEKELDQKTKLFPNRRNATLQKRIFSRYPFPARKGKKDDIRRHHLRDLFQ
ncbi:ATP-binding protein [Candidatus Sumerlaeota bacterium]|nr:ATP-binding protein [Candidatus Sumerlaeota bacterium]